jgi:uncharacterized protein
MLLRVLFLAVLIYLGLALMIFLFQSRLVFLPDIAGRDLVHTPASVGLAFEEVRFDTDDGETLHGWWLPHEQARATLLFHHGNAGNISHRLDSLMIFHDLGLNVFIYDYRGYGQSSGRPSEDGLYRDARASWRWLVEERQVAPAEIVLFGRSMGGAVAARLATEVDAAGLIVESSFSSVPDIGAEVYWWLPVRRLARIHLPTADYVSEAGMPVLVVHSPDDEIVPFSHAERIHAAAAEPRTLWPIKGDHNSGFFLHRDVYKQGLTQFLSEVLPEDPY